MKSPTPRTVPRFFVAATLSPGAEIELPERASRHIEVLRLAREAPVTLFNGRGGEYGAELTRLTRGAVRALVKAHHDVERESPLRIVLAQCVSGGDRMDLALQKATELGVARVVPLESERSVVRLPPERAERRLAHWRAVVAAACEQCGRNRVPDVPAITPLVEFLAAPAVAGLCLLLAPDADRSLAGCPASAAATLLIGPEGGLSPDERGRAEASGFRAVRFGPRTLRTETAPLAAIAAMQALWGDCRD